MFATLLKRPPLGCKNNFSELYCLDNGIYWPVFSGTGYTLEKIKKELVGAVTLPSVAAIREYEKDGHDSYWHLLSCYLITADKEAPAYVPWIIERLQIQRQQNKRPPHKVILMGKFCLHELCIVETIITTTSKNIISSNIIKVSAPNESSHIKALLEMRNEIPSCVFL